MLIDQAFDLILKLTGAQEALLQSEGVIWLQQKLGLDPDHPPDNFDSVYTYTLVDYTLDESGNRRPKALLTFFRHTKIRDFIRLAYEERSVSAELQQDVTELLIGPTGQELNALGIDIVTEMQHFETLFNEVVKRTRTPKEVRQEKDIAQKFSRIERQMQQQQQALQASIEQTVKQLAAGQSAALPGTAESKDFPLVSQVKAWFKALDYGEDNYTKAADDHCEWMITIPARRGFDRILVRCVEGEASPGDVEELYVALESQAADEGWLVYNRRISKTVLRLLEERQYRDVFSYTLDELIDQAADFSNYIEWLEKEVKARGIDTDYVQLACKKDDIDLTTQRKIGTSRYSDSEGGIEGYVDGWLEDDAKEHLSVLGEFGTGKTWFSFHYAWLALQKYQQTKAQGRMRSRLPLVIPLRDYAKALDVENVIANFFFNKHDIRITSKMFSQLNRMGKLLLIFDGFDEMAARVDKQAMINNFWELARVVGPGAKAILTCRTEHFPDAKQGRKLLSAELQASTKNLTGEPPEFEVLELEKFNESQIRTMLSNKTDGTIVETVMSNAKLMELAERPVMVDLILDALPKIESLDDVGELNMSRVYLYAVTRRLEKDWQEERTFTSMADKLYFLCEVSWEMLQTDQMSLHFTSFPERLQNLFGDKVREQKDLDHWHYDMMGQTMLVRDDEGNYRPAHRSLLEFFAAYKITASLGVMEEEFLKIARRQSHINEEAKPIGYGWEKYFKRQLNDRGDLIPVAPLQSFKTLPFTELVNLIGNNKLAKTVLDLAHLMVLRGTMIEKLLPLIQRTKANSLSDVGYVGSNIAQLMLRRDKYALEYADLSETCLPEVNFANASLRWASLKNAYLASPLFTKSLGAVSAVAISPDGRLLAVGDSKGTMQLWDIKTYQVLLLKKCHKSWIRSIVFNSDGSILATGSYDKTVKLWSVNEQHELGTLSGHEDKIRSVAFSPDGSILATGSADHTVKLWSVSEHRELTTLLGHNNWVNSVAFSPDGCILATGGSSENSIKLWSVSEQREIITLLGHNDWIRSVAFSPDGSILATGSADHTVKLWSVSEHRELITLSSHKKRINSMAFSPDGSILATSSADDTVKLWSLSSNSELAILSGHENSVSSVACSPDGLILATGGFDTMVKLWSVNEQYEIATLSGYENSVNSVVFSPDGRTLATASEDTTVKLWSVNKQCEVGTLSGHERRVNSVIFSPDGQTLATGSEDTTVKLWSVNKQCEVGTLSGHERRVNSVIFSPDGQTLATGSEDTTVKLWSVSEQREIANLVGHENWVRCITFTPDANILVTASEDTTAKLWSVSEQQELITFSGHTKPVVSVTVSPDSCTLATSSEDRTVKFWSVDQQREIATVTGYESWIKSVAFSPNGQILAMGSGDTTVKLWSVNEHREYNTLNGHRDGVRCVAFSPDGKKLATGSYDQSIRLWDLSTGCCTSMLDDRLCAGLDITGAIGLTDAQRTSLQLLGAVDYHHEQSTSPTVHGDAGHE